MFKWAIKLSKDFHVETKEKKNAERSERVINFKMKLSSDDVKVMSNVEL